MDIYCVDGLYFYKHCSNIKGGCWYLLDSYFSVENFVFTKRTIRFRNTKYLVRRRKILKSYTCIVTLNYVLYVITILVNTVTDNPPKIQKTGQWLTCSIDHEGLTDTH